MPVVDHYFDVSNQALPIFSQNRVMRLITSWYSKNPQRDKVRWSAILAVLALGLQSQVPGDAASQNYTRNLEWLDYCMRNTQSVIPELINRDEDLLGIQVILSLALLFRNSNDLRPSSTLLGMVVKLAHRMQLHSSDLAKYFDAEDSMQGSRVCWIIYTLDKVRLSRRQTR